MQPPVVAAGQTICRTDTGACPVDSRANARLIAAAPELLEACKAALAFISRKTWTAEQEEAWLNYTRLISLDTADFEDWLHRVITKAEDGL